MRAEIGPRSYPLIVVFTALAGCAGADCGGDWRAVGQRDGRLNAGSHVERYVARCGASVDSAAYEQGYREGFAQRPYVPSF